jgi:hypothetical protein
MSMADEKQTAGIGKGTPGPGRPKGVPNKATTAAKDAIAAAAEGLGGTERLVAWAQEDPANERVFWGTIYPKLLPLTVGGDAGNPLRFESVRRVIVDPKCNLT